MAHWKFTGFSCYCEEKKTKKNTPIHPKLLTFLFVIQRVDNSPLEEVFIIEIPVQGMEKRDKILMAVYHWWLEAIITWCVSQKTGMFSVFSLRLLFDMHRINC